MSAEFTLWVCEGKRNIEGGIYGKYGKDGMYGVGGGRRIGRFAFRGQASSRVKEVLSMYEGLKSQRAAKKLELDREVEVAKAALRTAEWNVGQQTLKSPIEGVVLDRPTSIGTRVAINDVFMRVADVKPMNLVMRAAVDEEDIAKVSIGQTVRMTLYAFAGQVFSGKGTKIYDQADAERRTFEVDVKLQQPSDRLSPGMTGELAFITAEKPVATVVPAQAVQGGAIWLVRDGRLVKSDAKVGIKSIEYFRVYNRWGELVFSTTINGQGWDGKIGGTPQATNTFVWIVKGIDYLEKPFVKKGAVTLIR